MAAFAEHDSGRVDWRLLQNGSINLYWRPEVLEADIARLTEYRYLINMFDCSNWHEEADLHKALKQALNFPDYYGGNLDSLNDLISQLDVPMESGRALVFRRFEMFSDRFPKPAWQLLDIIDANSQRAMLMGRRMIALVQSDNQRITFEPVGARPVMWNPKEWPNKSREV